MNYTPYNHLYKQPLSRRFKDQEEREKTSKLESRTRKNKPSTIAACILLLVGSIGLVSSIFYTSPILAFIGLGLTFWGVLFLFISPKEYIKSSLLSSTVAPLLVTIDRLIYNSNCKGKGIYLPNGFLEEQEQETVFISQEPNEEMISLKNLEGICITPPGLELANLFEKILRKKFSKVKMAYLQENLPKIFIEELEIAKNFKMEINGNLVHVEIAGSVYRDLCKRLIDLPQISRILGCPLSSAIACILTRATHNPIVIEKNDISQKGSITVQYRIIEE